MAKGYDLSHYQSGPIPGDAEFVFIKATQGTWQVDAMHDKHVADARNRGLVVGQYHYSDAGDPTTEAEYFIAHAGLEPGEAIVLDAEGVLTTRSNCVQWARAWLDHVVARTGAVGVLYASNSDLAARDWSPVTSKYHVWVARYGANPTVPYLIWQYTDSPLDTNTSPQTKDQLRARFAGLQYYTVITANVIPKGVDMLVVFQAKFGCWWVIPADLSHKAFLHPNDKGGYEQLAKAAGVTLGEGALTDDTLNRIPDVAGAQAVAVVSIPKP